MSTALSIAAGLVFGIGVPWIGMRMFAPSLVASPSRVNFRGREVHLGLGVVWVLWAGGAMAASLLVSGGDAGPTPSGLLILAGPLALAAFALGLIDDALGSADDRGFDGHVRALASGRLTTGMLKLLGISAACLVAAAIASGFAPWGRDAGSLVTRVVLTLVAGASVALTSNLLNLLDLRPGRALKSYATLGLVGAAIAALMRPSTFENGVPLPAGEYAVGFVMLALFVLGPVFAVWGEDLGEHSMLGDAGANPAGAVAGLLIVVALPAWGLGAYFVVVLAVNLASERWSFTRIIEANGLLSYLDGLGRLPADAAASANSAKTSPQSSNSDG
jgi:UDP-GlcNAc:undecaprenyl-phosphate/decaprenyl-phosphate GlcNAc-1-phosphate transferase